MRSLLAALTLTTALTLPGLAAARPVTLSTTLGNYGGDGAYLALYVTDATGAGDDVEAVETEGADEVVNRYPITTLTDSDQSDEAKAFVEFITGPEGQKVLGDKGFGAP